MTLTAWNQWKQVIPEKGQQLNTSHLTLLIQGNCGITILEFYNWHIRNEIFLCILTITYLDYRVSKKTLLKEMCDFLTLKMLPLALALINTKYAIFLTHWSENAHSHEKLKFLMARHSPIETN